jgi:cysteinyl-tRNA synthetase
MTTNREIIEMLKILKEQSFKSHNDTAVLEVKIDSFNFVLDKAIKSLEAWENKVKKAREEIDDLTYVESYVEPYSVIYDVLKSDLNNNTKLYLIEDFDKVLSLDLLKKEEVDESLVKYIEGKIEERKNYKANKEYDKADLVRKELEEKGIILKDTREGTIYEIL